MPDQYEDGVEPLDGGFYPAPRDVQEEYHSFSPQTEQGQSYDQDEDSIFRPLPSLMGGLDRLRARKEREINKLYTQAQRAPVYQNEDGTLTKTPPQQYLSGTFTPIGGAAPYRIENPEHVPVQLKMAEQLKNRTTFPSLADGTPLTNAYVYENAPRIWDEMLRASNGNMDQRNFLTSPIWNQFKGLDNESLAVLKTEVGKAIMPFYKPYVQKQKAMKELKDQITDPENGPMFMHFFMPHEKEIIARAGTDQAKTLINTIRSKAETLTNDPDAMQAFTELEKSSKIIPPSDGTMMQSQLDELVKEKNYYRSLMATRSSSGFATILNHYTQYKQGVKQKRDKLTQLVSDQFEDASGAERFQEVFTKVVESGYYDGREWELGKDLKRLRKSDGMVKIGDFPPIPGAKMLFDEKEALNKIQELKNNGYSDSNIFVTPDRKVLAGPAFEDFKREDIRLRFPDSGIKQQGKYVALRADIFRDENEQTVFLTIPGAKDQSPITYVSGDKQYVLRDALTKVGITEEDLKSGDDLVLGRNKQDFLAQKATPYETKFINASQFGSEEIPNGQRFTYDKEFYKAYQDRQNLVDSLTEKALLMSGDPTSPTYTSEISKAAVRGLGKTLTTGAMISAEGMDILGETLKTAFYRIAGKDKEAEAAWGRAGAAWISIKGINSAVEEAADGGFIGLDQVVRDPNATTGQHVAGTVGEIGGTIGGIALEMYATGGLGAPQLASKLTQLGSKLMGAEKQIRALSALSGNAAKIAQIQTNISRANIIVNESLNFMAQNLMTGKVTPTEIAEGGLYGLALGGGRAIGRGFNIKGSSPGLKEVETLQGLQYRQIPGMKAEPRMIDKWRFTAATAGAAGVIGLDTIIKQHRGMTPEQIVEWWKDPNNMAGMALQLMVPYFGGSSKVHPESINRVQQGPPHATALPGAPLMGTALNDYWKLATTSELGARGKFVSDQIEKFTKSNLEVPESLIKEYEVIKKSLLGDEYAQGIILKDAKAKDTGSWEVLKKVVPQLENKFPAKEVKLLGMRKVPEGPQISEVSSMSPAELTSYINTVRDNPVRQYQEAGRFNAAIKKIVDFRNSDEFAQLGDKGLSKSINNIAEDQHLLVRAARPEEVSQKLGDEIVDTKTGNSVESHVIDAALKIKQIEPIYDAIKARKAQAALRKKETREIAGRSEVKVEKTEEGWVARARVHGRGDVGTAEYKIPNSKELTKSEAQFLANDHFEAQYYKYGEKMQQQVAEEVYGGKEKSPFEEISDVDKEIANAVFSDAFEGGKDIQGAIKKLTSEKYGFTKDEVSSMFSDYIREKGHSLGEMRDFLDSEFKQNGC